jgi:hypothetical protein
VDTVNSTPAPASALEQCRTGDANALAAKVRALVQEDRPDGGIGAYDRLVDVPWLPSMSDEQSAVFEWAYVFGIAYGIARGEDPYEPISSVSARAFEAARPVHRDFTGGRLDGATA